MHSQCFGGVWVVGCSAFRNSCGCLYISKGRNSELGSRVEEIKKKDADEVFTRLEVDEARTLLDFITASIVEKHPALKLPADFFEIHLRQKGCLVMFDGVDEVDPDDRERIREAIEALVAEFNR